MNKTYTSEDVKQLKLKEHLTYDIVKYFRQDKFNLQKTPKLIKIIMEEIEHNLNNLNINKKGLTMTLLRGVLMNLDVEEDQQKMIMKIAPSIIDTYIDISLNNTNLNNNKRSFIIKGLKFIIGFLLPMWKSMHYSQEMIKFMKYTENNIEKFDYDVSTDSDTE
jgi:hypothetical protein|tara:strand:- start:607 stop:1095 length:489 start_codon:yes stop_codon:yes gene_type:complete